MEEFDMKKLVNVKNRSAGIVMYMIPDHSIRRQFTPNEVKKIAYEELVWLTYQPGGRTLLEDYLQVEDPNAISNLEVKVEPEYSMSEADIENLLLNGSLDELLDALDFAPEGVIDIIKAKAVSLPLQDMLKREAIQNATGFNVTAAINFSAPDPEEEEVVEEPTRPTRRVVKKPESKYNIVG